jgi:hypothetical protein
MNAFVVSGLIKRRAELAGEIERTHEALRKMVLDLENLDATILQGQGRPRSSTAGVSGPSVRCPESACGRSAIASVGKDAIGSRCRA